MREVLPGILRLVEHRAEQIHQRRIEILRRAADITALHPIDVLLDPAGQGPLVDHRILAQQGAVTIDLALQQQIPIRQ